MKKFKTGVDSRHAEQYITAMTTTNDNNTALTYDALTYDAAATLAAADRLAALIPKADAAKYAALRSGFEASLAEGCWQKHVSRSLTACFAKPLGHGRGASLVRESLDRLARASSRWDDKRSLGELAGALYWGFRYGASYFARRTRAPYLDGQDMTADEITQVREAMAVDLENRVKPREIQAAKEAFDLVVAHRADADLLDRVCGILDAQRPKPTFTLLGVSPTITATLSAMGFTGAADAWVETPKLIVERTDDGGWRVRLVWPEGTVFNTSRFALSGDHCHACGHRIKNPYNWVPAVVMATGQAPRAVWVGHDCAESVFGVKAENRVAFREAQTQTQTQTA